MSFPTTIPAPCAVACGSAIRSRPTVLGAGELPNVRLQRALSRPGRVTALDRVLSIVHWVWFFEPHLSLLFVQARHVDRFPRAARQMAATYDLGCAIYYAVPTAPPWWASEQGYMRPPVEQIPRTWLPTPPSGLRPRSGGSWSMSERASGAAPGTGCTTSRGNPWAAMPSLHFGDLADGRAAARRDRPDSGALGVGYAAALAFALVYLGSTTSPTCSPAPRSSL